MSDFTVHSLLTLPDYYDRYIRLVPDKMDLREALIECHPFGHDITWKTLENIGDLVYSQQKWTMKQIVQHLIDTERIMAYRALCIARRDKTPLPGFDENNYVDTSEADSRTFESLKHEFHVLRQSTIELFATFDHEIMRRSGICSERKISVGALGFVICGHPIHHLKVIEERYLPLLKN